MDGADWIEMAQMADSNSIDSFGVLITLMSGYLVVAYLVGAKLTRPQVSIVNSLYILSALSVVMCHWQYNYNAMLARHHAEAYVPDLFGLTTRTEIFAVPLGLSLINIGLIIASLYFMWSIRHPAAVEESPK